MDCFAWGCLLWTMPAVVPLQPRASDIIRFPDWQTCEARQKELLAFADWHKEQREHQPVWPWSDGTAYWASRNQEEWAREAAECWRHLASATCPTNSKSYRLSCLSAVLKYLGRERYQAGILPPTVPQWWHP